MKRREFLAASASAVALTQNSLMANSANIEKLPIIDTHQHLWDLKKFKLPWLDEIPQLKKSFLTKDYLEAAKGLNIVKTVYMEVDVAQGSQTAEAKRVIELCKDKSAPTVAGVIDGNLNDPNFEKFISEFKDSPYIKGVRHLLMIPSEKKGTCLGEQFMKNIVVLNKLKMTFDFCMRAGELEDGAKLAKKYPYNRFILDHCGNADPEAFYPKSKQIRKPQHDPEKWKKGIEIIAKQKNVICKLSGIVARARKGKWKPENLAPILNHCIDSFGVDRCIFASDWPVCTLGASLAEWVNGLKEVTKSRGTDSQRKIFHDNAQKFYGLGE